jgi:hypothetical protein
MQRMSLRKAVGALAIVSCSLMTTASLAHADDDDITVLPPIEVIGTPEEDSGGGSIGGGIGFPGGGGGGGGQPPEQLETITVTATPLSATEKAALNDAVKGKEYPGAIEALERFGYTAVRRISGDPRSVAWMQRANPLTNIILICDSGVCSVDNL